MIIREIENPGLKDFFRDFTLRRRREDIIQGPGVLNKIKIVGSGKGAIAIVLKYLNEKKIITNKLDEVMVADWMGYWVYNQIQQFAFPSKRFSDRTKVLFVYHQYGFPQDMDKILEFAYEKKIVVIEDCAHAIASYYKGKPLGSFGDFSIFSFSKWFFCFALGGVKSKFKDFEIYAGKLISNTPFGLTLIKDLAKFLYEQSTFSHCKIYRKYAKLFLDMSYSLYGEVLKPSCLAVRLLFSKIEKEINVRQKRYHYFLKQTDHLGICDHLERDGITPYVIPISYPESKNKMLIQTLRKRGVMTGLYHFDVNRNMLSPKFIPVVWIPCHGGISDKDFSDITNLVVQILKK